MGEQIVYGWVASMQIIISTYTGVPPFLQVQISNF